MNVETGKVYRTKEDIEAALQRGEKLVEVSEQVAEAVELNRAERMGQTVLRVGWTK